MATTSIHPIFTTDAQAVEYCINPKKTENGLFVESYMCSSIANQTAKDFQKCRDSGTGQSHILAQHLYQSFREGEVTPQQAIEIGKQLAERLLKGEYQYVLVTHTDKKHIHNHIVFNNVNMENGKSFETLENRKKNLWKKLREISDKLCKENGLSVIDNAEQSKGKSWFEWSQNCAGLSWKSKLKFEIDNEIMESKSFDDFLNICKEKNIEAVYKPANKIDLKFRMVGQEKYTRAKTLGWYYETMQIKKRIENYRLILSGELSYKPRTKIINTANDKFASSVGLERWAKIQNMKEASRLINFLTNRNISDGTELEARSITEYSHRMKIVSELNKLQTDIDRISDTIKDVHAYKKYKKVSDDYKHHNAVSRKSYAKKFASQLKKFEIAKANLLVSYPNKKVPSADVLAKEKERLIQQRNEKNDEYKAIVSELKELDFARNTIADYLQNERDVEEQKKKHSDLE